VEIVDLLQNGTNTTFDLGNLISFWYETQAMPCPLDIHDFWAMWISRGWFGWEQQGYPFWGNLHRTQSWWNYRHWDNILFLHFADMLADPARVDVELGVDRGQMVINCMMADD
jgi:hypothetical protein